MGTKLPPRQTYHFDMRSTVIFITDHAIERISQRFPAWKDKAEKVATKAWNGAHKVIIKDIRTEYADARKYSHRLWNGAVFIFEVKEDCIILVTVYRH